MHCSEKVVPGRKFCHKHQLRKNQYARDAQKALVAKRIENKQCTICGSSELKTNKYCAKCAEHSRITRMTKLFDDEESQ